MPKILCDWDCCKHHNMDTGYCDNSDEVVLTTTQIDVVDDNGKETGDKLELFECESFVNYEEGEAEQVEGKIT